MTVEELLARESIRDTLATCNMAGDRLRLDDFIAAFTADVKFEVHEHRMQGRHAVRTYMLGLPGVGAAEMAPRSRFIRHHLTTCLIRLTGSTSADVRSYFAVYTAIGPDHCGYYADKFQCIDGRWLIAERKVRIDWTRAAAESVNDVETRLFMSLVSDWA
jgi:hypothetical protein